MKIFVTPSLSDFWKWEKKENATNKKKKITEDEMIKVRETVKPEEQREQNKSKEEEERKKNR